MGQRFKSPLLQQYYEMALRIGSATDGRHGRAFRHGFTHPHGHMPAWIVRMSRDHAWWRAGVDAALQSSGCARTSTARSAAREPRGAHDESRTAGNLVV